MLITQALNFAVELNGLQDFIADRITVTFPQTDSTAEVVMPVTIPIINDDTNEATEGLYLLVTINTLESNPTDVANAVVLRNGVALVRIRDDDGKVIIKQEFPQKFRVKRY